MEEFYRMNAGSSVVEQKTDLAILWPMLINDPIQKECHRLWAYCMEYLTKFGRSQSALPEKWNLMSISYFGRLCFFKHYILWKTLKVF